MHICLAESAASVKKQRDQEKSELAPSILLRC